LSARIRGVVFDFDGTVTKPFFDFAAIKDEIGMPRDMLIIEYLQDKSDDFCSKAQEILDRWELRAAKEAELNDYFPEMLNYLNEKEIKTAVLTRNKMESVEIVQKKFNLDFNYIDTRDIEPIKPHPEAMERVIKVLEIRPEELLTIGDYEHDILCGKEAGTLTMYLTNRNSNYNLKIEPDYIIKDLREGLNIIRSLI
jgi:HAD superfamily hydrolase (TIGR01509 family)